MNRVYVCYVKLSRKRPDFEKPSRDRGPQPRTLYSSLLSVSEKPYFWSQLHDKKYFNKINTEKSITRAVTRSMTKLINLPLIQSNLSLLNP